MLPETNLTLALITTTQGPHLQATWTRAYPNGTFSRDLLVFNSADCSGATVDSVSQYFQVGTTTYLPPRYGTYSYKIRTSNSSPAQQVTSTCSNPVLFTGAGFARNLSWSEIAPYAVGVMVQSLSGHPTWAPVASGAPNVGGQQIQYFTGQYCDVAIGSPVSLGAAASTTTFTPTVGTFTHYTYRIITLGSNGAANSISTCSSALYIDTHDQSATNLMWEQPSPFTGTRIQAMWTSNLSAASLQNTPHPNDIQFFQGNNCQNPVTDRLVQNPVNQTLFLWAPPYSGTFTFKVFSGNGIAGLPQTSACSPPIIFNNGSVWQGASDAMLSQLPHSTSSVVWSGSEMIFWASCPGADQPLAFAGTCTNVMKKYNPALDAWVTSASPTGAVPMGRIKHSAIWSGTEMIVWGGYNPSVTGYFLRNGGKYNPVTNAWAGVYENLSTSVPYDQRPPEKRGGHVAVWTGSKMIIYGGSYLLGTNPVANGGIYDPVADLWSAVTPNSGNPQAFNSGFGAMAVWAPTVNKMLIYGGDFAVNAGAPYVGKTFDPVTKNWAPMAAGPWGASGIPAFWNGTEMEFFRFKITAQDLAETPSLAAFYGGPNTTIQSDLYNPVTDTWSTRAGEPPPYRTGYDLIVTGPPLNRIYLIGGTTGAQLHSDALYLTRP